MRAPRLRGDGGKVTEVAGQCEGIEGQSAPPVCSAHSLTVRTTLCYGDCRRDPLPPRGAAMRREGHGSRGCASLSARRSGGTLICRSGGDPGGGGRAAARRRRVASGTGRVVRE